MLPASALVESKEKPPQVRQPPAPEFMRRRNPSSSSSQELSPQPCPAPVASSPQKAPEAHCTCARTKRCHRQEEAGRWGGPTPAHLIFDDIDKQAAPGSTTNIRTPSQHRDEGSSTGVGNPKKSANEISIRGATDGIFGFSNPSSSGRPFLERNWLPLEVIENDHSHGRRVCFCP